MKLTLNLASRTYLNRRALYAFYAALTVLLLLLLVLNISLCARSLSRAGQLRSHLAELEKSAAAGGAGAATEFSPAAYEKLTGRIAFANEILAQDSFRWTELLDRLEEVVPHGVSVQGLQPNFKQNALSLSGLAVSVPALQEFLDRLIASPHFGEVFLLQQALAGKEGEPAVRFSVQIKGVF
jgi:type IV pilus assembly protein PilN